MLVTFCAKTVADMIGHGIYDTHIAIRGTPFLEAHDQPGFAEHGFMAEDKLKVGGGWGADWQADRCSFFRPQN